MKNLAILQARCSSTRLPGKVLKDLEGRPMIDQQISRVLQSKRLGQLIVATSTDPSDNILAQHLLDQGAKVFRGSLDDVLDRYYQAGSLHRGETIIRLTGDCPLFDPGLLDELIDYFEQGNFDYASNSLQATYPDGLDAEIFKFSALERAWKNARIPSDREHVTPYIHKLREPFLIGFKKNSVDYSDHRWTVDNTQDFEMVKAVYSKLYSENPFFNWRDILNLLEKHPEIREINQGIQRNEGYESSIKKDGAL
ncbi:MAG: spore coat protein [Proteobacteria bacterium]|nr:MAG: spore coat protein [Pseudomonadota bacterium]